MTSSGFVGNCGKCKAREKKQQIKRFESSDGGERETEERRGEEGGGEKKRRREVIGKKGARIGKRGVKGRYRRIGRIIEWYVTVLCRFARNVGAVSELMAAGQMFRGFSAELSCPRAQHNAGDSLCARFRRIHVAVLCIPYSYVTHAYLANIATRYAYILAESASSNVYITCTVTAAHLVANTLHNAPEYARFCLKLSKCLKLA